MHTFRNAHLDFDDEIVWDVLSSKQFLRQLVTQLAPFDLGLPDSFYLGSPHTGEVNVCGKTYEYDARLKIDQDARTIVLTVFTDVVDGTLRIRLQPKNSSTEIVGEIDIEAPAMLNLLMSSGKKQVDQKLSDAYELLEKQVRSV